jgi:uncharacterized protein (TIGR00725 family)
MADSSIPVGVFGSSAPREGDPNYEAARQVGRELARRRALVVCGGYGGVMEAVCRGAAGEGGESLGVLLEGRGEPNAWVTRSVREQDRAARLRRLLHETRAAIFLPRGLGTIVEITFFAESVAKCDVPPRPLIFLGESWRALATLAIAEATGPGAAELRTCVRFAATPAAAVEMAVPGE